MNKKRPSAPRRQSGCASPAQPAWLLTRTRSPRRASHLPHRRYARFSRLTFRRRLVSSLTPTRAPCHTHQAFVAHYYQAFDAEATRPSLAALYQPQSMLSFEGSQLMVRRLYKWHRQLPLLAQNRGGRVAGAGW